MERVVEELTHLLMELMKGRIQLSKEGKNILSNADCLQLAFAQRELITSHNQTSEAIWQTWKNNKDILPDIAEKLRKQLPDDHIVKRILAEHDMILCLVADLYNTNLEIQHLNSATSNTIEIRKLANISGHLLSMDQHSWREDDLIFPQLRSKGFGNISLTIMAQHNQIINCYHKLNQLIWNIEKHEFSYFKDMLNEIVKQLVPTIRKHIFIENNIILPLVLEFMKEKNFWEKIKELNDQMGYCGYYS